MRQMELLVIPASSSMQLGTLIDAASKVEDAQIFDADSISSVKHIELAFFHAQAAFKEKTNLTNSLKMEFLLRAAATRQIKIAIDRCGVKNPERILLAVWGKEEDNMAKILLTFKAKKKKLKADEYYLISLYKLDKKKDIEEQILEKMVKAQVED